MYFRKKRYIDGGCKNKSKNRKEKKKLQISQFLKKINKIELVSAPNLNIGH